MWDVHVLMEWVLLGLFTVAGLIVGAAQIVAEAPVLFFVLFVALCIGLWNACGGPQRKVKAV